MGDEASFDVFTSKGDSYFLYHDESKNQGNYEFKPKNDKQTMTFSQFYDTVRHCPVSCDNFSA
jgi:hypothetical protein